MRIEKQSEQWHIIFWSYRLRSYYHNKNAEVQRSRRIAAQTKSTIPSFLKDVLEDNKQ